MSGEGRGGDVRNDGIVKEEGGGLFELFILGTGTCSNGHRGIFLYKP